MQYSVRIINIVRDLVQFDSMIHNVLSRICAIVSIHFLLFSFLSDEFMLFVCRTLRQLQKTTTKQLEEETKTMEERIRSLKLQLSKEKQQRE